MNMTKNFIDEIQIFVNKVERRVLQLEHIIFNPLESLRVDLKDDNLGPIHSKKRKR